MKEYLMTERSNLFEPNNIIAMKFSIKGMVEPEMVGKAFDLAVKANEVLGSKIVIAASGQAWYESTEETHNQMHVIQGTWERVWEEERKRIFNIDKGEWIRGFLFHGIEKSECLILAHHLAGDGKSIVYFIEQMMDLLSGKEVSHRKFQTISVEEIKRIGKIPIVMKSFISFMNRSWKKNSMSFSMEDRSKVFETYWNETQIKFTKEHFTKNQLEQVVAKSKEAGTSLTSYILAAFTREFQGKVSIGLAVDGRIDTNRNMGNQTGGFTIFHRYCAKRKLCDNAKVIQRELHKKLLDRKKKYQVLYFLGKIEGTLLDSVFMELWGKLDSPVSRKMVKICGYKQFANELSVSNLTILDIGNQYGDYLIDDFVFIPPYVSYGKRMLGVVTLDGEMNITYQVADDAKEEIKRFHHIMRRLKE